MKETEMEINSQDEMFKQLHCDTAAGRGGGWLPQGGSRGSCRHARTQAVQKKHEKGARAFANSKMFHTFIKMPE